MIRFGYLLLLILLGACDSERPLLVECNHHFECPSGYTCNFETQWCVIESSCDVDEDCCPGLVCFNGGCRQLDECKTDSDCMATDTQCVRGSCFTSLCQSDLDCEGKGHVCRANRCLKSELCGDCGPQKACDPASLRCIESPASCTGLVCPEGAQPVIQSADSSYGFVCDFGGAACTCISNQTETPMHGGPWLNLVGEVSSGLSIIAHSMHDGSVVMRSATGATIPAWSTLASSGVDIVGGAHPKGLVVLARDPEKQVLNFISTESVAYALDPEPGSGYGADLVVTIDGQIHASYITRQADGWASVRYASSSVITKIPAVTDWKYQLVSTDEVELPQEAPCGGKCQLPNICVEKDGKDVCDIADILDRCNPRCSRYQVCVSGECLLQRRGTYGLRLWDVTPAGDTAIAARGGHVLVASYNHRKGVISLGKRGDSGAFDMISVAGGQGLDVGQNLELAVTSTGTVALAYHDALREELVLQLGDSHQTLTPAYTAPGGAGIDLHLRDDGTLVLAHGAVDGTALTVIWGQPGDWKYLSPAYLDHVGRFNSLWIDGDAAVVATLVDRLDSGLKPSPEVSVISFVLSQ